MSRLRQESTMPKYRGFTHKGREKNNRFVNGATKPSPHAQ
jgi:hypothetical protein